MTNECKVVIRDGVPFRETPRGELYSVTLLDCGAEIERLQKDLRRANAALVRHGVQEMIPGNSPMNAPEPTAARYCQHGSLVQDLPGKPNATMCDNWPCAPLKSSAPPPFAIGAHVRFIDSADDHAEWVVYRLHDGWVYLHVADDRTYTHFARPEQLRALRTNEQQSEDK